MKMYFVIFCCLMFQCAAAQEADSMRYFLKAFKDTSLTAEQRKVFGRKIRNLQGERYQQSRPKKDTSLYAIHRSINQWSVELDSFSNILFTVALDTAKSRAVRLEALQLLNTLDTYAADSFLVAKFTYITYLKYDDIDVEEVEAMFPCLYLLFQKSYNNYAILKPLVDNLYTTKKEGEAFWLGQLLLSITTDSKTATILLEHLAARNHNYPIFLKNIQDIIQEIKED